MLRLLDRRRRDGGHRRAILDERGEVADDEHLGVPCDREIGPHGDPSVAVEGNSERAPESGARDAGGPQHGARRDALAPHAHALAVDRRHLLSGPDVDADADELLAGLLAQARRVRRQDAIGTLEEDDVRLRRVDVPEVARERVLRDLAERAGELDARRPRAHDDERQPRLALRRVLLPLGELERREDRFAGSRGRRRCS